jgi:transposase
VAKVVLDDTDKSYVASFPWAKLRLYLKYKLDERRIAVEFIPPETSRKAKGQPAIKETVEE